MTESNNLEAAEISFTFLWLAQSPHKTSATKRIKSNFPYAVTHSKYQPVETKEQIPQKTQFDYYKKAAERLSEYDPLECPRDRICCKSPH